MCIACLTIKVQTSPRNYIFLTSVPFTATGDFLKNLKLNGSIMEMAMFEFKNEKE